MVTVVIHGLADFFTRVHHKWPYTMEVLILLYGSLGLRLTILYDRFIDWLPCYEDKVEQAVPLATGAMVRQQRRKAQLAHSVFGFHVVPRPKY